MNDPAIKEETVLLTSNFIAGVFTDWRSYEGKQEVIKEGKKSLRKASIPVSHSTCESGHKMKGASWKFRGQN